MININEREITGTKSKKSVPRKSTPSDPRPLDGIPEPYKSRIESMLFIFMEAVIAMALIYSLAGIVQIYVPNVPIDPYKNYIALIGGAAAVYIYNTVGKQ